MLFLALAFLSLVVATIAAGIYAISPYGKGFEKPVSTLRPGERLGIYVAAFYPGVSLVALMVISSLMHIGAGREVMFTFSYFLFFGGQFLLSAYSVAVCWYLRKQNRAFNILLVTSLLSGACYLFMVTFAFLAD